MGRMPVALIIALAASLGLHAAALFGPDIDLAPEPEAPPLVAELRPLPPEPAPPIEPARREAEPKPEKRAMPARRPPSQRPAAPKEPAVSMPSTIPAPEPEVPVPPPAQPAPDPVAQTPPAPEPSVPAVSRERLPPRGSIRFRVDRGDSGFEIGRARLDWELDGERYRLSLSAETTGLAWLIRSADLEMESVGSFTAQGLQPEAFGSVRDGRRSRERALFDWETMRIRVGERREYPLEPGTQDLLSVFFQLGFVEIASGKTAAMPLATGKKYAGFRVENLGDEEIEIPLGVLRTRHLRLPGDKSTEVWLAYDYRLLPVKIRHFDNKGGVDVQVATEILFGQ